MFSTSWKIGFCRNKLLRKNSVILQLADELLHFVSFEDLVNRDTLLDDLVFLFDLASNTTTVFLPQGGFPDR